jgi:hypothetical protein
MGRIRVRIDHKIVSYTSVRGVYKLYLGTSKIYDENNLRGIYRINGCEVNIYRNDGTIDAIPAQPLRDIIEAISAKPRKILKRMLTNYHNYRLHTTLYVNDKVAFCSISKYNSTYKSWEDGIEIDDCCYFQCGPNLRKKLESFLEEYFKIRHYEF